MVKGKKQESKKKDGDKVYKELEVLKSMLARALADYDNLSKRVERERGVLSKIASLGILTRLLPVLDNLESAQDHLQDTGLAISIGEFKKILNEEGLLEIVPKVGEEFNEDTMEAIEVVAGARDNIISGVTLNGWKFKDGQAVRHAKVKVSKISNS
ncbi:MAG: Protein GrpE [Candidatus Woesebacteria bacterium GW2011_GWD1_41_12]|uniref:Protein GrpE n=3 Tax=Candidatus Woeseibacteriota TaxID=1752722 RepID=A0A0G0WYM5_9BACT|nr:MAG: Protein GrpE [Candidatus Woesebacteria bacterium GW2011_GWD1_41_12]KKS05374.1 MAG: Protein GrpE [Candidatus Woesebacteria bacterium GW2011_GWE1_41_24]KKS17894.1 MAG: Protein GrpE [Candidatus Woesebacteria bacterium GW2011_GWA1_41_7]